MDCSKRFVFFGLIDFVVEYPKIDPIPFFSPRIVVDELRKIGERLSVIGEASRHYSQAKAFSTLVVGARGLGEIKDITLGL